MHWPCRVVPTLLIALITATSIVSLAHHPTPPPEQLEARNPPPPRRLRGFICLLANRHTTTQHGGTALPRDANGVPRAPSPTPPTIDPQIIVDYLEKVLEVNLGAVERDLHAPGSLLSDDKRTNTLQRCAQFSKENQLVLYVVKERSPEASIVGLDGTDGKRRPNLPISKPTLTLNRRLAPLHLLCFERTHRLPSLRSICCPSEAPDTHRLFDTP